MLKVGLTGGIGSGKSTVAARLAEQGAVVVDADAVAREVVAAGSAGLRDVVAEFGPDVLRADGSLDRGALAAVVFADPARRRALEGVTHPLIARRTAELVTAAPADAVVVHDVPLLVEKGMGAQYHLVVVVDAPEPVRVDRLVRFRGLPADDAWARVRAQATDDDRRAAADVLLDNAGAPDGVLADVDRLWRDRLVPFESNVRTGRRSRCSDALVLVGPDPTWAAQAARLAARVARAAGDLGRGVEHIGSTAVPGLLAKDVIDLQLGVDSMATPDVVAQRLAAAGFPPVGDRDHDHPKPAGEEPWPQRLHGSADPGRVAKVHVRGIGTPGWTSALLIRDWLRADAAARSDYAAQKRRLGRLHPRTSDYAAAKEPWLTLAHERALAWARRTGWTPPSR